MKSWTTKRYFMCSYKDRVRAVDLYSTHDHCIAATMRELGYPSRGTLTAWVREAFPEAKDRLHKFPATSA